MVDDVFGINEVSRFNRFFQGRDIFARNGETLLSFISDSGSETSVEQNDIVEIFFSFLLKHDILVEDLPFI